MNPILILTARELFSEFKMTDFYSFYGDKADYARSVYMQDDMEELCDFTQSALPRHAFISPVVRGETQEKSGAVGGKTPGTPSW
jgi:hypothetical protein